MSNTKAATDKPKTDLDAEMHSNSKSEVELEKQ